MRMLESPALTFDLDDVLRSQGAEPSSLRARSPRLLEIAERALEEGRGLLQPKVYVNELMVAGIRHERIVLEGEGSPYLGGKLVMQHFMKARKIHAMLCTIGGRIDTRIAECMRTNPTYALALNAVGSAAVEALSSGACRRLEDEVAADGMQVSIPLSPGMVDWPVEDGQAQLFRLFEGEEVDVQLTSGFMMSPRKSLSMVVGSGPEMEAAGRACDYCSMKETCRYQDHYAEAR